MSCWEAAVGSMVGECTSWAGTKHRHGSFFPLPSLPGLGYKSGFSFFCIFNLIVGISAIPKNTSTHLRLSLIFCGQEREV